MFCKCHLNSGAPKARNEIRVLLGFDRTTPFQVRKPSMVRLESSADSGPLSEGDTFTLSCRVLTDSAAHAVNLLIWRDARLLSKEDPRVTLTTQRQRNRWRLSVANITRRDAGR